MPAQADEPLLQPALDWFARRGWTAFAYQREAWRAYLRGQSGLVHAPTGTGKTLSVFGGPLLEAVAGGRAHAKAHDGHGLRVLWLTPLRALAADTAAALTEAVEALGLDWRVELRTGDTGAAARKKQRERLPEVLITTPESLSLLLSYPETAEAMRSARCVVCDEWHELMGTKRGVQTELCLGALRAANPRLRTWGLSATLGNLDEAMRVLLGAGAARGELIRGDLSKPLDVRVLIPADIERFPWAGHLGLRQLPGVIEAVEAAASTLVFTNTRSQTEIWFQSILKARPDWIGSVALHHGSLERGLRRDVEAMVKGGSLRCVVCTSSLDLGVDFRPVDQVIQIGSPKGAARLLQRAGRSGHRPGVASRVLCVPTNAMELVEFAAARDAIEGRRVEGRVPLTLALDVLVQHLTTLAIGAADTGIAETELLGQARGTHAFAGITAEQWRWCVDYLCGGGPALAAYPQYARIANDGGVLRLRDRRHARTHRLGIGTISSEESMRVVLGRGAGGGGMDLGHIEEGFVALLRPGDAFTFAGHILRLVRVREMVAYAQRATRRGGRVPSWAGGRMPLSNELSRAMRAKVADASRGVLAGQEMAALAPLLGVQRQWSSLPGEDELLIELVRTDEGHHAFLYPFDGRLVHEGLSALVAYRLGRVRPQSFVMACNDHGFEIASSDEIAGDEAAWRAALSPEGLVDDLLACLNASELAKRQFRGIARVAGLLVPSFPGQARRTRHVQASAELFYDVFTEFDPENLLLDQARREVLEQQLELRRTREALERLATVRLVIRRPGRLTPLAFPLWADSLRAELSSEKWADRVARMLARLEADATGASVPRHESGPEVRIKRRRTRRVAR